MPFHWVSSPGSDAEVEVHLNPSSSHTYPVPSSSQVPPTARHSTAFSTPNQAEITDFDPRDISVDSDDESFVCPSDPEEEVPDIHTPTPCLVRSYQFSSFFIEHSEEQNSDLEDEDKPDQSSHRNRNEVQLPPPMINSTADLIKLVPQRAFREESVSSGTSVDSSSCEEENEGVRHQLSVSVAEEPNSCDPRGAVQELTMDRSILEEHQRVLSTLAKSIVNKDVRIDKFRGYENGDITRWFRKLELQLEAKKIPTTEPAAITQVVNNLGGPAETFLFELPEEETRDYGRLEQALTRRHSTKDRTWVKRQLLVSWRQEANETLADYINGMHELFSGLNCSEPEKVTYFTEGLKSSLKVKVLERMPETLLEAEELARTFNSISRRLEDNEPQSLEKLLSKLLTQKQESSSHVFPEKPPAWVEAEIGKLLASTTPYKTTVAALNESRDKREDLSQQLKDELRQLKDLLLDKIDSQNTHFDACWLDKIKASVMRYHVKGQERDSHAVLPVDELAILLSTAPNTETQAHSHFLRNHIPLADLIINRIPVIINNEIIIAICHSKIDVN